MGHSKRLLFSTVEKHVRLVFGNTPYPQIRSVEQMYEAAGIAGSDKQKRKYLGGKMTEIQRHGLATPIRSGVNHQTVEAWELTPKGVQLLSYPAERASQSNAAHASRANPIPSTPTLSFEDLMKQLADFRDRNPHLQIDVSIGMRKEVSNAR